MELTKKLIKKGISISRINKEAGLTRRTIYKCINNDIKEIKFDTKMKLYSISSKYNRKYTLNRVIKRFNKLEKILNDTRTKMLSQELLH